RRHTRFSRDWSSDVCSSDLLRQAGVEVIPFLRDSDDIGALPFTRRALLPVSPLWNPDAARDFAKLVRDRRPDLLHLHNPYPLLSDRKSAGEGKGVAARGAGA